MQSFEDKLQAPWVFHRQPRPQQHKEHKQQNRDQNLHGYEIRDGGLGIDRLDVQNPQQRQSKAAKISI